MATDGSEVIKCTAVECLALASTSIVCDDEVDKATGSGVGVDDHTIKLPLTCESTVCRKVSSCCAECVKATVKNLENEKSSDPGLTATDLV